MPYAFLHPDGTIKMVVPKPTPFMKVGEGERIVNYNPPLADPELETVTPVLPVPADAMAVEFTITPKEQPVYEQVHTRRKSALVQHHLDTTAQRKGYDNIVAAISYAGSGHPVYSAEGVAFAVWRNQCWDTTFEILEAVFAGSRPMPSDAEFIAELPAAPI